MAPWHNHFPEYRQSRGTLIKAIAVKDDYLHHIATIIACHLIFSFLHHGVKFLIFYDARSMLNNKNLRSWLQASTGLSQYKDCISRYGNLHWKKDIHWTILPLSRWYNKVNVWLPLSLQAINWHEIKMMMWLQLMTQNAIYTNINISLEICT